VSHYSYPVNTPFANRASDVLLKIAGVDVSEIRSTLSVNDTGTIFLLGPVCRGCYRVPFAGIGSLEVNRTIVNLLESLSHSELRPMLQAKCALCKLDDTITVNTFLFSLVMLFDRCRYVNIAAKLSVTNAVDSTMMNSVNRYARN
jgi:hypothetical protein